MYFKRRYPEAPLPLMSKWYICQARSVLQLRTTTERLHWGMRENGYFILVDMANMDKNCYFCSHLKQVLVFWLKNRNPTNKSVAREFNSMYVIFYFAVIDSLVYCKFSGQRSGSLSASGQELQVGLCAMAGTKPLSTPINLQIVTTDKIVLQAAAKAVQGSLHGLWGAPREKRRAQAWRKLGSGWVGRGVVCGFKVASLVWIIKAFDRILNFSDPKRSKA